MATTATETIFLLLLLLVLELQVINAYTPEQRVDAACVFMATSASIFCYGGQNLISPDSPNIQPIVGDIFTKLDLSKNISLVEMQSGWEQVYSDAGANFYFAFEAVPSRDMIFMDGGQGATNTQGQIPARHNSTFYNGETGKWSTNTPARGAMVQAHTATLGQDDNTIYVWGGYGSVNTGLPTGSPPVYPLEMYMFDIMASQWKTGNAVESLDATRFHHKAARVGTSIYYIGGKYPLASNQSQIRGAPMDIIPIFDTENGQWRTQGTTGSTPSQRIRHSVTLIPSTGQIVLLGGQDPFNPSIINRDYFYLLDTKKMEWSNITIGEEGVRFNGTGMRGHSSVLVGDNLFILFGRAGDVNMELTNTRVWVLNVIRWTWISSVDAVIPQPLAPGGDDTQSGGGKSAGTIAGAVVGAVAGIGIIIAAFFLIRKRQRKSINKHKPNNDNLPFTDPLPNYNNQEEYKNSNIPEKSHYSLLHVNEPPHSLENSADNSTTTQETPNFHGTEKPDASVASGSSNKNDNVEVRRVMLSVKPDGA